MAKERLRISLKRQPAMVVNRIAVGDLKLCYVLCANRSIPYDTGRSPIIYMGTTRNGIDRVAQSAAAKSWVLGMHGVTSFEVRIVTCGSRQRIRSWHKLERALLLTFRDKFGTVPICNTVGKNFVETDEFRLFSRSRVSAVIEGLTRSGAADEVEISD